MFELPPARKETRCGYKWDNEAQELVDTGKGCGQWIFLEKLKDGKWKITNSRDGRGGKRGERHLCHNTGYHEYDSGWKLKYRLAMTQHPCVICGIRFNSYVFCLCPNCFHKECRKCKHHLPWKVNDKGESVNMTCPKCGHDKFEIRQQQWSYNLLHREEYDVTGKPLSESV